MSANPSKTEQKTMDILVAWPGREEMRLKLQTNAAGEILSADLTGIGGPDFLNALKSYRKNLSGQVSALPEPSGREPWNIQLREVIKKAKGTWDFPYKDEELCHCRVVATAVVDLAICTGAHTARKVSELTSASTACGTCRPDVEAILKYRLG